MLEFRICDNTHCFSEWFGGTEPNWLIGSYLPNWLLSSKVENEDSLSSLVDISLGSILFSSVGLDSSITKCVVSSMVPSEGGLVTVDSAIGGIFSGGFGVLLILVSDS